jgi:hypothetical protein
MSIICRDGGRLGRSPSQHINRDVVRLRSSTVTSSKNYHRQDEDAFGYYIIESFEVTMRNTCYQQPAYRPKPSESIRKHAVLIRSDNDLWVEHSYRNESGQDICYYRSVRTPGKSQRLEPPTGAATIVYQQDIAADPTLRCHLPGPLSMRELREVPESTPILHGTSRRGARTLFGRKFFSRRQEWSIEIPTLRSSFDSVSSFSRS